MRQFYIYVGSNGPSINHVNLLPNGQVGVPYSLQLTGIGGTPPYTYALLFGSFVPGLSLSPSGLISGTPTAPGDSGIIIAITDSAGLVGVGQNFALAVIPTVTITTATPLPQGSVGSAYSQTLASSGGYSPYTYAVTSGSLPTGLGLSAAGVISGTPTVGIVSDPFTVTSTDNFAYTGSKAFTLTIAGSTLAITTSSLPAAQVGSAYNFTMAASGGITPYTWVITSGTLPAGLSFSSAGVFSGTPTASGSVSLTIKVTDSTTPTAQTASKPLTLTVNPAVSISSNPIGGAVQVGTYDGVPSIWKNGVRQSSGFVTAGLPDRNPVNLDSSGWPLSDWGMILFEGNVNAGNAQWSGTWTIGYISKGNGPATQYGYTTSTGGLRF